MKNYNPEKYGFQERSAYDKKMLSAYNTNTSYQFAWKESRSSYDQNLQKKWCSNCNGKIIEKYHNGELSRSAYDKQLQQKWCPKCPNDSRPGVQPSLNFSIYERYNKPMTVHDPDNRWSYTASSYRR